MAETDRAKQKIIRMETGERIRRERVAIGMSRRQLAELIGVSEKTVVSIETGEHGTTIYRMIEIADALNTSLDYLLRGYADSLMRSEEEVLVAKAAEYIRKAPPEKRKRLLEAMNAIYMCMM